VGNATGAHAPPGARTPARGLWLGLLLAGLVALLAGLVLREPLERAWLTKKLQAASGYRVSLGRVEHAGPSLVLAQLEVRSENGTFVASFPRVTATVRNDVAVLDLQAPRIALLPERWRRVSLVRLQTALRALHLERAEAQVHDGSLSLSAGTVPALAANVDNVRGTARLSAAGISYDIAADVRDGARRFPVNAHAGADGRGDWEAVSLPLGPLAELGADAPARVRDGLVRDLSLRWDPAHPARLDARLEGGVVELDGGHRLSGLHGEFALAARAFSSRLLVGNYDQIPFTYAGEVDDLPPAPRWLWSGSPQLRALERMTVAIGQQPELRSLAVESTAPGLCYGEYALSSEHGPLALSLLWIDPHERTLHFDTAIAEDRVISGGERTSAMGVRTHAVAGVNGDYFDIGRTYQPQGMLIRSGQLVRGPTDRHALTIDRAGHVAFAEYRIRGVALAGARRYPITQVNDWPPGETTVITKAFGKTLPAAPGVSFAALRAIDRAAGRYVVDSIQAMDGPVPVAFGLAFGRLIARPLPHAGEAIRLSYALDPPASGAVAGIGGGPRLLKDGAWFDDPHAPAPDERDVRWPVIALGRLPDDTLVFVAVDGRHPERSVGMTRPEFGDVLQRLGATDAMALDSGGSVTLVARAPGDANVTVRNHPSDDSSERWVSDGLFLYSSAPLPALLAPREASTPTPETRPAP
jgi:hypothetical protein